MSPATGSESADAAFLHHSKKSLFYFQAPAHLLSLVLSFSSIACALCDILLALANPHQPGYWP